MGELNVKQRVFNVDSVTKLRPFFSLKPKISNVSLITSVVLFDEIWNLGSKIRLKPSLLQKNEEKTQTFSLSGQ